MIKQTILCWWWWWWLFVNVGLGISEQIPKVIHVAFVPNKWNRGSHINLMQYASVRSAYVKWKKPCIYFWYTELPSNDTPYFDLLKPILTLKQVELPRNSQKQLCLIQAPEKVEKWIGLEALYNFGGALMDTDIIWLKSPPSAWFFTSDTDVLLGNEESSPFDSPLNALKLSTSFVLAKRFSPYLKALLLEYETLCLVGTYNYLNTGLPTILWSQYSEEIVVLPSHRLYTPDWDELLSVFTQEATSHAPIFASDQIAYRAWDNAYDPYIRSLTVPEIFWRETLFNSIIRPYILPLYWEVFVKTGLAALNNWPRKCPWNPCLEHHKFISHLQVCKVGGGVGRRNKLLIKQRYLPGHGHFGYFHQMHNVCIGAYMSNVGDIKLIQSLYVKMEGDKLPVNVKSTIDIDGKPTNLMYWLNQFSPLADFPSHSDRCYYNGTTLIFENTNGTSGHIGHFAEGVWKAFSFIPQAVRNVDRFWMLNRLGPANDWEVKTLNIVLDKTDVDMKDEKEYQNVVYHQRQGCGPGKNLLCFEHALFPQSNQRWFMSEQNVQEMRERVDRYCAVKRVQRKRPVLGYIPRIGYRRITNAAEILKLGEELGYEIAPINNLTDFCAQVHLFASMDVVFSKHGTHFTGMVFMNPYSVAIELNNPNIRLGNRRITEWKLNAYYAHINYLEYDQAIVNNHFPYSISQHYLKDCDIEVPLEDARRYLLYALKIWRDPTYRQRSCMQPEIVEPGDIEWRFMWENNQELCVPQ